MSYREGSKYSGHKLLGIAVVVILHILMIYALANFTAISIVEYYLPPLEVILIEDIRPPPKPETPLTQKYLRKVPKIKPPQVSLSTITPVPSEFAITADHGEVSSEGTDSSGENLRDKRQMRPAQIDIKRPCPRPVYPAGSIPEEQQGTVVLKLLISPDGEVLDSAVDSSSGFGNLDEAARRALSRCLYKPAVNDRNIQNNWAIFKYRWRLE